MQKHTAVVCRTRAAAAGRRSRADHSPPAPAAAQALPCPELGQPHSGALMGAHASGVICTALPSIITWGGVGAAPGPASQNRRCWAVAASTSCTCLAAGAGSSDRGGVCL